MKRTILFLILFFLLSGIFAFGQSGVQDSSGYDYSDIKVLEVVDGSTLLLESGEKVRLIGIYIPGMKEKDKIYEYGEWDKESSANRTIKSIAEVAVETIKNLTQGKRVRLEFDAKKYDGSKRLMAYVFLKDGAFLNAEIIRRGFAKVENIPPNMKYADLFVKSYEEAQENHRGLWK